MQPKELVVPQTDRVGRRKSKKPWKVRLKQNLVRNRWAYVMMAPVIVWFLIFCYWPMTYLGMAFYDYKFLKGYAGSEFIWLDNFKEFFSARGDAWNIIWNTLAINLLALVFVFPAPIVFALLLNEIRLKAFKTGVQIIMYLPHFLSTTAFVAFIINFLSPSLGPIGQLFSSLGLEPVYFMGEAKYFRGIQVVSGIWQTMGWNSIVYMAALAGVDTEMYEAARVDGANRRNIVFRITIPAILPTIMIMLIMQLGQILGSNFEKIYLMQNTMNKDVSEVLSTYVYKQAIREGEYGMSTAAGLFNSVISLLFVLGSNWLSKKFTETGIF